MKLWEVTNGFMGYGLVHVLVVAESEADAKRIASEAFKSENDSRHPRNHYPKGYWEVSSLSASCLCEDVTREWVSAVQD